MDDCGRARCGAVRAGESGVSEDFYEQPKHGWTCFHCGETFKTPGSARNHFGFDPSFDPACRIKLGAERGLVSALRKSERAALEANEALHAESAEGLKALRAAEGRYREQLTAIEELGYERGVRDGRRSCVQCGNVPLRDILDGDPLCQQCCDKWVRAEAPDAMQEPSA